MQQMSHLRPGQHQYKRCQEALSWPSKLPPHRTASPARLKWRKLADDISCKMSPERAANFRALKRNSRGLEAFMLTNGKFLQDETAHYRAFDITLRQRVNLKAAGLASGMLALSPQDLPAIT